MKQVVTVRLDEELEEMLDRYCTISGKTRSEVIREATRRQLEIFLFESLRQRIMPFAEARGYLTDDDVFRDISWSARSRRGGSARMF